MPNNFTVIKKIKEFFIALFIALAVGTIAGLIARYSVFPIMGLLHNRWVDILSHETVKLVYFWIGQIVGTLVFVVYMYKDLLDRNWSMIFSIIAVIISLLLLVTTGIVSGIILGVMASSS